MTHPLPLILGALLVVAVLAAGTVAYLGHKRYRLSFTLEPKVMPAAPKPAPEVTP